MASDSTNGNQLSKLQFIGVIVATTLIGGFLLSKIISPNDQPVEQTEKIPILPEYPQSQTPEEPKVITPPLQASASRENTQTVVLVPRTQAQVDCVLGGGGVACFDENYRPNYPTTSNQEEWEEWERREEEKRNWIKRLF
ncbi:hypothetical protein ACL6C3_11645 [Capilliphycus salinus ALCB114379]|uniref:hypothetical protein n=1 Tax=Capilliphycus salinus TaxID=2768948 RepID=UPI0039A675A5